MTIYIHMLGTGAAMPISRGLPCIALRVDSSIYLLDVGEGCQYRLFRSGLSPLKIKAVFITHLHGDHYLGIFGLFQTMHLSGRRDDLIVAAPSELLTIIKTFVDTGLYRSSYRLVFVRVKEGMVYSDHLVNIEAFPVCHGIEAYGYRVTSKREGYRLVYTGDTMPCESIVENSRDASLLIHESTFHSSISEEAHSQGHSTSADAAMDAAKAGVKMLVLTHISARYRDPMFLYYDAYRYFRNVVVAEDYMLLRG